MNSHRTERFDKALDRLPERIRARARAAYRRFKRDPYDPHLHFTCVHPSEPLYSVRIDEDYRALGIRDGDEIVWFWIGGHEEYDKIVKRWP